MSDDFDLGQLGDIPDPLAALGELPPLPPPAEPERRPPTRAQVTNLRLLALAGAFAYEGVVLGVMNKRDDLHSMPRATLFLEFAIPFVAAVLAFLAAATSGRFGVGAPKLRLAALALASPLVFATATLLAGPIDADAVAFAWHAVRCFLWTGLFAVGPLLLAVWAFRGTFVAAPAWRTAALGMACAALGAASMSVTCSVGTPSHVLLGHGGMMVVAGLAGALAGRRLGQA